MPPKINPAAIWQKGFDAGQKNQQRKNQEDKAMVDLTEVKTLLIFCLLAAVQQPPFAAGNPIILITTTDKSFEVSSGDEDMKLGTALRCAVQSHAADVVVKLTAGAQGPANTYSPILIKAATAAKAAAAGERLIRNDASGEMWMRAPDSDLSLAVDKVDVADYRILIQKQARPMSMAAEPKAGKGKGGEAPDGSNYGDVDGKGVPHFMHCSKCQSYSHHTQQCPN